MKIKSVEILDDGKEVMIELCELPDKLLDYTFIYLRAEDLPAIADVSEKW